MRISDWSSDVCSSDLRLVLLGADVTGHFAVRLERHEHCVIAGLAVWRQITFDPGGECRLLRGLRGEVGADLLDWAIRGLREDTYRKSVVSRNTMPVRGNLCSRRIINKNNISLINRVYTLSLTHTK